MEKQLIISIGREFGSGGHEIAEILAKHYGLNLYDKNLLQEIANEKSVEVKNLEKYDDCLLYTSNVYKRQLMFRQRKTEKKAWTRKRRRRCRALPMRRQTRKRNGMKP